MTKADPNARLDQGARRILERALDAVALPINIRRWQMLSRVDALPCRYLRTVRTKPMMMAHDSSPGDGLLDDETISALRIALMDYAAAPADGERLRVALHTMAVEAKQKGMFPEKLLVLLKDVWYGLPSVRSQKEPNDQVRLLQRIVTMCIREYYTD